jgi:putative transposase
MVSVSLAGLPEARRRRAIERYDKLRPHLERGVPLKRVAEETGVPLRTAQRWVSRYRRGGLAGLSRTARADRGKSRRLSDDLRGYAEGLALQRPALRPGAIYREVCRAACERGQDPPSYHTVYHVIRSAPATAAPAARSHEKVLGLPARPGEIEPK